MSETSAPSPAVSAIVLAGGRSRRMGRDKTGLLLHGETLLQRTVRAVAAVADEVIVVRAPGAALPDLDVPCPLRVVDDPVEGEGPLVGMIAGLEVARAPVVLIVGGDLPFLHSALLRLLVRRVEAGARWVLPVADGRRQTLCSAMSREALPVLRAHVAQGDRSPLTLIDDLDAAWLGDEEWRSADPEGASFIDVDTPEDLAAAVARLESGLRGG